MPTNEPSAPAPAGDEPPSELIESLQAYALLTYLLCSIAALVLFAAAYDAADPKLPATALVTLAAVFVAASFARAEAAPAALLMAGVGLSVAILKSRHPDDLSDTGIYGTLAFALLGSGMAAYWVFGPGLSGPRPFNRVDAVHSAGVAAALIAVLLVAAILASQWVDASPPNDPSDWHPRDAFTVSQSLGLALPTLLVALILGARIKLPGAWDFITRVDKDHVCRSTELIVLAGGWALLGLVVGAIVTDAGTDAPPLASAAAGVLAGVLIWVASTFLEPESLIERRSMRREWGIGAVGLLLFALTIYGAIAGDGPAFGYGLTGLALYAGAVARWRHNVRRRSRARAHSQGSPRDDAHH